MEMHELIELLIRKEVITKEEVQMVYDMKMLGKTLRMQMNSDIIDGSITTATISGHSFTGSKFKQDLE